MTAVADLALPYVVVALDTRPPAVRADVSARVEPPDPLVVVVRADEPVGVVRARFSDASGASWLVGHERVDDRTVRVEMPTVGVSTGGGTLRLEVLDLVCNPAVIERPVFIDRPRAYDVLVGTRHAREVWVAPDHSYEVVQHVRPARAMEVTLDVR